MKDILQLLQNNLEFNHILLNQDDRIAQETIVTILPSDLFGEDRTMSFTLLPLDDIATSDVKFLQFYSQLPSDIRSDQSNKVVEEINALNATMPIGNLMVHNDEIGMRYIFPLYTDLREGKEPLLEALGLFLITLDSVTLALKKNIFD